MLLGRNDASALAEYSWKAEPPCGAPVSRPAPANWPESHKKRFRVLVNTEQFKLAQQLRDEPLARAAVEDWIKYDPDNRQLQEIYKSLHPVDLR